MDYSDYTMSFSFGSAGNENAPENRNAPCAATQSGANEINHCYYTTEKESCQMHMQRKGMQKLYTNLRGVMRAYDYSQADLALHLGYSTVYINERLNGHKPWNMNDMYGIMELFHLPLTDISFYFPKDGITTEKRGARRQ